MKTEKIDGIEKRLIEKIKTTRNILNNLQETFGGKNPVSDTENRINVLNDNTGCYFGHHWLENNFIYIKWWTHIDIEDLINRKIDNETFTRCIENAINDPYIPNEGKTRYRQFLEELKNTPYKK